MSLSMKTELIVPDEYSGVKTKGTSFQSNYQPLSEIINLEYLYNQVCLFWIVVKAKYNPGFASIKLSWHTPISQLSHFIKN